MRDERGTRGDAIHASARDNGAAGRRETICAGGKYAHGTAVHSERRGAASLIGGGPRVQQDPVSAVDERLGERGGDSERGGEGSVAGGELLGGHANIRGGERSVRGADTAVGGCPT